MKTKLSTRRYNFFISTLARDWTKHSILFFFSFSSNIITQSGSCLTIKYNMLRSAQNTGNIWDKSYDLQFGLFHFYISIWENQFWLVANQVKDFLLKFGLHKNTKIL